MFSDTGNSLLVGSILLLISVLAGKALKRLGIPTLIFFLVIGILAGSEGIGGIHFDNAALSQFIGIVALNFILFSGGLDTNWESIKPVLWRGIALSTVGVILTGMGRHGAAGLLQMKKMGAVTVAQDEQSCIVFGMPREAIKLDAVDHILSLDEMPARLMGLCH